METIKVTKLRALRAERGLTIEQLAERSGLGRSTLYRIESLGLRPSRQTYEKLFKVFEIDESEMKNIDLTEIVDCDARWVHGNTRTF